MTPLHARLIELDRKKADVKAFYEEYSNVLNALVTQHGVNHAFADEQGVVYQLVELDGKWVPYEKYGVERTRRDGEARGTLSIKKAKELGFSPKE